MVLSCSVATCDRLAYGRGWCQAHYQRWRKTGDVQADKPIGPYIFGPKAKWDVYIDRNGPVPANRPDLGPCWVWTGRTDALGYGKMRGDGREVLTHRWGYEHFVGPVPDGLELDHLCRNPACCNYERHLEPVTRRENQLRGETLAARLAARTACSKGHPYTPENTYYNSRDNARQCKACNREKCHERYLRRKARKAAKAN